MTILGFNFGRNRGEPAIASVGGSLCMTSVWLSRTSIECHVPSGLDQGQYVQVDVTTCPTGALDCLTPQKMVGRAPSVFTYDCPVVTQFYPNNGLPRDGDATVTITGTNFGSNANGYAPKVNIGPTECVRTTWASQSSLTCVTPRSSALSQLSQLDVSVSVGKCFGALPEVAFYQQANVFNPWDMPPFPEGEVADIAYLTCGPDRNDIYAHEDIVKKGNAVLYAPHGVTSVKDGVLVSAVGNGELFQKLFALPLYSFDSREATYTLTVKMAGDFDLIETPVDGQAVRMDLIMGIGNSRKFYGVRKSVGTDINMGYVVEGFYDGVSNVLQLPDGADQAGNFGPWTDSLDTRTTPQSVTVSFQAKKQPNSQLIDMTITMRHGSSVGVRTIRNFELEGGALEYEFVVFRQNKKQSFKIKELRLSLCGCNEPSYDSDEGNCPI